MWKQEIKYLKVKKAKVIKCRIFQCFSLHEDKLKSQNCFTNPRQNPSTGLEEQ